MVSGPFNMSMQTGILPTDWTASQVIPVFKRRSKHLPSNYRPTCISLTSLAVKCMERITSKKMQHFLRNLVNYRLISMVFIQVILVNPNFWHLCISGPKVWMIGLQQM